MEENIRQSESTTKHKFSFYIDIQLNRSSNIIIDDKELLNRINNVLKFKIKDHFILFNNLYNCDAQIININKKYIEVEIQNIKKNSKFNNYIKYFLPILKKDDFEESIYYLAEIGIQEIQPIITSKSRKISLNLKDFERLNKIIIAACEQSKNFDIPKINKEIDIYDITEKDLANYKLRLLAYEHGENIYQDLYNISKHELNENTSIAIISGPEGGLIKEEIDKINNKLNFKAMILNKNIIKASHTSLIISSLLRIIFN